jgi:hypothetical protein
VHFLFDPAALQKTPPGIGDVLLREQFSHSQSQTAVSAAPRKDPAYRGKEIIIMEYFVVLATMLMIALYALIIGRTLRNSEHH